MHEGEERLGVNREILLICETIQKSNDIQKDFQNVAKELRGLFGAREVVVYLLSMKERMVCAALGGMSPVLHSLDEAVCIDFPTKEVGRVATSILVDWIDSGTPPGGADTVYLSPRRP